jgi:hypothetical protein
VPSLPGADPCETERIGKVGQVVASAGLTYHRFLHAD